MRNLKVLGTALVAVLALSAVMASMASADVFKSSSGAVTTVTGNQEVVAKFVTTAGSAECKKATYTGSATSGSSSVLVTPAYSECTCIGVACTIDTNGCQFRLNITTTTGTADVVCPGSATITLTNTKCTIHVGSQTGLGTVTYSNKGAGTTKEVGLSFTIEKQIKYSHTEGSGVGKCTTGSSTTGTITGTASATGEIGANHEGIFVE